MTPRTMHEAAKHGTYYQFEIRGWIEGLSFPAADTLEEAYEWVLEFEKMFCTNPLIVTGVQRILDGSSIGCKFVQDVENWQDRLRPSTAFFTF